MDVKFRIRNQTIKCNSLFLLITFVLNTLLILSCNLIPRKGQCTVLVEACLHFGALGAVEGELQAEAAVGAGRRGHVTVTGTELGT